jgi:EpsD family peptidyl-prolyl cis-trans isomerase
MPTHVFRRALGGILLACASAALLPGCSRSATDKPTQLIARVGGSEISMLQFNHALTSNGLANPGEPLRKEIAAKLVDRELAVQQALEGRLDRQPDVMLKIEEARRDILARAYAERTAALAEKPGENDAARYFARHPELFAERKIFRLRETVLSADMQAMPELKNRLAQKQTAEQVTGWLREQQVPFNEQVVIRAAEQLPIESLPRLNGAADGQTVIFESPRGVIIYKVLATQPAALSWDAAKPIVRDYLARQTGKRTVDSEILHLRGSTKIVWLGDFAPLFAGPAARVP